MTLLLKQIFQLLKLLNSDTGTNQIAAGIAVGFILGMSPAFSLQAIIIVILMLLFRIQVGAALVSAFFFKFIAYALDPAFDALGTQVLEMEALRTLFTTLYNLPIIPFTRFNNSIVMGAGIIGFALSPLIFVFSRIFVQKYRKNVVERFQDSKLWKMLKATSLYKWYYKYDKLYR